MKYSVLKAINGSVAVDSEWSALEKAIVQFHSVCTNLWNASDVEYATVMIVDDKLRSLGNYIEKVKYSE